MSSPLIALVVASKLASRSQQSSPKAKELLRSLLPIAHFLLHSISAHLAQAMLDIHIQSRETPFCLRACRKPNIGQDR